MFLFKSIVNYKNATKVCDVAITGGIAWAAFVFLHISSLRTVVQTPCKDVHGENFAVNWVLDGLCTYAKENLKPLKSLNLRPQ